MNLRSCRETPDINILTYAELYVIHHLYKVYYMLMSKVS